MGWRLRILPGLIASLVLAACGGGSIPGPDAPRAAPLVCAAEPPPGGMVAAMVNVAEG